MTHHNHTTIAVQAAVNVPVEAAWDYWNLPEHITGWYFASDGWQAILDNFKKYAEAKSWTKGNNV